MRSKASTSPARHRSLFSSLQAILMLLVGWWCLFSMVSGRASRRRLAYGRRSLGQGVASTTWDPTWLAGSVAWATRPLSTQRRRVGMVAMLGLMLERLAGVRAEDNPPGELMFNPLLTPPGGAPMNAVAEAWWGGPELRGRRLSPSSGGQPIMNAPFSPYQPPSGGEGGVVDRELGGRFPETLPAPRVDPSMLPPSGLGVGGMPILDRDSWNSLISVEVTDAEVVKAAPSSSVKELTLEERMKSMKKVMASDGQDPDAEPGETQAAMRRLISETPSREDKAVLVASVTQLSDRPGGDSDEALFELAAQTRRRRRTKEKRGAATLNRLSGHQGMGMRQRLMAAGGGRITSATDQLSGGSCSRPGLAPSLCTQIQELQMAEVSRSTKGEVSSDDLDGAERDARPVGDVDGADSLTDDAEAKRCAKHHKLNKERLEAKKDEEAAEAAATGSEASTLAAQEAACKKKGGSWHTGEDFGTLCSLPSGEQTFMSTVQEGFSLVSDVSQTVAPIMDVMVLQVQFEAGIEKITALEQEHRQKYPSKSSKSPLVFRRMRSSQINGFKERVEEAQKAWGESPAKKLPRSVHRDMLDKVGKDTQRRGLGGIKNGNRRILERPITQGKLLVKRSVPSKMSGQIMKGVSAIGNNKLVKATGKFMGWFGLALTAFDATKVYVETGSGSAAMKHLVKKGAASALSSALLAPVLVTGATMALVVLGPVAGLVGVAVVATAYFMMNKKLTELLETYVFGSEFVEKLIDTTIPQAFSEAMAMTHRAYKMAVGLWRRIKQHSRKMAFLSGVRGQFLRLRGHRWRHGRMLDACNEAYMDAVGRLTQASRNPASTEEGSAGSESSKVDEHLDTLAACYAEADDQMHTKMSAVSKALLQLHVQHQHHGLDLMALTEQAFKESFPALAAQADEPERPVVPTDEVDQFDPSAPNLLEIEGTGPRARHLRGVSKHHARLGLVHRVWEGLVEQAAEVEARMLEAGTLEPLPPPRPQDGSAVVADEPAMLPP